MVIFLRIRTILISLLIFNFLFPPLSVLSFPVFARSPEPRFNWVKAVNDVTFNRIFTDTQGNLYVSGAFQNTINFNPDGPVDNKTSNGSYDAFVTKFSSDGTYQWTKAWGGTGYDNVSTITITPIGDIVMAGLFENTVNFNPDGVADNRTSNGSWDIYLTKYTAEGAYEWTKTWGGIGMEGNGSITADSTDSTIAVTSSFTNTVNFNPEGIADNRTSNGSSDAFITTFSSDGTVQWTKTWGGTAGEFTYGVAIDSSDQIVISGTFQNTVNFNPDGAADNRTSNGSTDAFITTFSSDGTVQWTKTWGGIGTDTTSALSTTLYGDIAVTGFFQNTINFNPDGPEDNLTSNGSWDDYLTTYSRDGVYGWTKTWGGVGADTSGKPLITSNGDILVVGYFADTLNFNSDGPADYRTSTGGNDFYLTLYSQAGAYQWTKTWGGTGADIGNGIAAIPNGDIVAVGTFTNTVDFNPGSPEGEMTVVGSAGYLLMYTYAAGIPGDAPPSFPTIGPSGCSGTAPSGKPDLYQIKTTDTTASLRFAPSGNPVTEYQILYGYTSDGIPRFGTTIPYGPTTGSIDYEISSLTPRTGYFFTIRGANNCMAGAWSNKLNITTDTANHTGSLMYYEYYPHVVRM